MTIKTKKQRKRRSLENLAYKKKYPEKIAATQAASRLKIPWRKGYEKHHWSYKEEHFLDVIPLSKQEHVTLHRYIIYDQERRMYRRTDNMQLLDSKKLHIDYIMQIIGI